MKRMIVKVALIVAIIVLSILVGAVVAVLADDGIPTEPVVPDIVDVLALIAEGVGAGFVLAFLAEKFEWFQQLPSRTKWWLILIVSLAFPVVAQALLDYVPLDVWSQIEPYWRALALGFVGWAGSQAVHLGHKALIIAGRE